MEHEGSDGVCEVAKGARGSASLEALDGFEEELGVYLEFRGGIMRDRWFIAGGFWVEFLTDAFNMRGDRGNR